MANTHRYSPEVRERAVRLVFEHRDEYDSEWAAIRSIAGKFGCSAETLHDWARNACTSGSSLRTPLTSLANSTVSETKHELLSTIRRLVPHSRTAHC